MSKLSGNFYIMGYGSLGQHLYKFFKNNEALKFMGFLDNKQTGENIYKPEIIENKDAVILIASINYMYEMSCQLKGLGFKNVIDFANLTLMYPELQKFNQAFLGLKEDYENNKEKYEQLRKLLADDKSKKVLDAIIEFRKTYNINVYSKIADNINIQYFEQFMPKGENIFIDGGAYDGDTVLRAIKQGFNFKKIYFFEPDDTSLEKAKNNLKNMSNVEFLPYGLSDKEKILKFDTRGNLGSCFSDEGDTEIKCVSLDETIKENRAFLKLDIEGAEIDAINGAKRLLQNGSPFAICVYHKPSDIWKIPELLIDILYGKDMTFYSDNKCPFYLRHYTNTVFDTILYGVPE